MSARAASAFWRSSATGRIIPRSLRRSAYLRREQEPDGSWFGRWGTNYIYGTWSVLAALNAAGVDPRRRKSAARSAGCSPASATTAAGAKAANAIGPRRRTARHPYSTPSQTAWALLGLMAAGEVGHPAVARGIAYLIDTQDRDGNWDEPWYTAVGFPRVFYLRYHGYRVYFPLWALARYRRLAGAAAGKVTFGL